MEEVEFKHTCEGCKRKTNNVKPTGMYTPDGKWITKRLCTYCRMDLNKVEQ